VQKVNQHIRVAGTTHFPDLDLDPYQRILSSHECQPHNHASMAAMEEIPDGPVLADSRLIIDSPVRPNIALVI
jgi:hypothetical protein